MQLRYLGDSHDYLKFALLRHLHPMLKVRVGINWYLTDPEENRDGEQRHHMTGRNWGKLDAPLFEMLKPFQKLEHRSLPNFEASGIFSEGTLYYSVNLPDTNLRRAWQNQATATLAEAELVFLDPDNGFEVPSMSNRTQAKYALFKEAAEFARRGQIVVGIQFARQCDPVARARSVRQNLTENFPDCAGIPVIRCRVSPNILFLLLAPKDRLAGVIDALESFEAKSPIHKKNQRRVELIT